MSQQPVLPRPIVRTEVWCLDRDGQPVSAAHFENPPPQATRRRRLGACDLHVGIDGRPKGVQIPHGAVVNLLRSMQRGQGLGNNNAAGRHDLPVFLTLPGCFPLIVGARVAGEPGVPGRCASMTCDGPGRHRRAGDARHVRMLGQWLVSHLQLTILCGGEEPSRTRGRLLTRGAALWNM